MLFAALVAVASMFAQDVMAQPKSDADKAAAKARSEEIMATRMQMLKDELNLTDTQLAAFEPVYREYRKVITRVVDHKSVRVKKEEVTNENALQIVSTRLANTISTSAIKQRYLWVFAEIIEPVQVEKLYRIEDRISKEARKVVQYKK